MILSRQAFPRSPGFTLVELMIGLTLVSLIVVLLFSGLRIGVRSWDRVEVQAERQGATRAAMDFIRRALVQMQPASIDLESGHRLVFSGTESAIEFPAPLSGAVGLSGLYILRLERLEDKNSDGALVMSRWLLHPEVIAGDAGVPAWTPLDEGGSSPRAGDEGEPGVAYGWHVLLEDVGELRFAYYGSGSPGEQPGWQSAWENTTQLPQAVRISLDVRGESWPDLYVGLPTVAEEGGLAGVGVRSGGSGFGPPPPSGGK